ncbi:MAG TPA: GntR family transcriptional regulator [Candidatus Sulfotelmatobacter sp.]|nr:GntR family transcriptional regulator [Candidatus Sulfotelmatobacter sp.]
MQRPRVPPNNGDLGETTGPPLAGLARKKLGQETTRYLRDALLSGQYETGERMAVHHLAESLGVSTMPVREALVTLANEGLLEVIPRRGFRVARMGLRDVEDAFRVHAFVAGLLIEEAAPIITASTVAELRGIQEAILLSFGLVLDEHQLAHRVEELNFRFHRTINHVPDAIRLRWFLRAAARYVPRRFYETIPGWKEATRDRHGAIIDALEARDAGEARRLMEQHVIEAGALVREHLEASAR